MNVRLLPEAEADVTGVYDWYAQRSPSTAERFDKALHQRLSHVAEFPLACPKEYKDYRRAVLRRFPYVMFYLPTEKEIVVFGVFHGYRDPAAWRDRLDA